MIVTEQAIEIWQSRRGKILREGQRKKKANVSKRLRSHEHWSSRQSSERRKCLYYRITNQSQIENARAGFEAIALLPQREFGL